MPNDEASIRMTVDNSQAISENQKYVRAATETFNILLQKSEQYSSNLKQRAQFLEHEIELMKERSRLNQTEEIGGIRERYKSGQITSAAERKSIRQTKEVYSEEAQELKELTKITKQWTNDQRIAQQKAERMGENFTRMLPGVLSADTAGGVAGAASSGLLGALGVAGILGGIAITKELRGAATMEPAMRDYAILHNKALIDTVTDVNAIDNKDIWRMGMKPSEYFPKASQLTRAAGGVINEDMTGIIAGERARGISLSNVMGVERYGEGRVTNIERYFERYLRATSQSIAILPEILQTFTGEASRMIKVSGKIDTAAIAASIAAIGQGFGLRGEPLQNVYSTMQQGLQQSSNPAIQALQYSSMERAMPGSSFLQMRMAMENPMEHPQYVINMLDQIRKISVGRDMYAQNIFAAGLAPSLNLAYDMSGKNLTLENFTKETQKFKKTGVGGYEEEAARVYGATEKVAARIQGGWERTGFNNTELLAKQLSDLLNGFSDTLTTVNDSIQSTMNFGAEQLQLAKESKTLTSKILHTLEGLAAYGSNVGLGPTR